MGEGSQIKRLKKQGSRGDTRLRLWVTRVTIKKGSHQVSQAHVAQSYLHPTVIIASNIWSKQYNKRRIPTTRRKALFLYSLPHSALN